MQPQSALANRKKQLQESLKPKGPRMSVEQSKEIMNDLLGELDNEDEDNEVQFAMQSNQAAAKMSIDTEMAFNKEEEIDMKYNIKTNAAELQSKKRTIDNITKQSRSNPFAKDSNSRQAPAQQQSVNSSKFESAQGEAPKEQVVDQEEINQVTQMEDAKPQAQESAIEKEWRQIKQQNEQEKAAQLVDSNQPVTNFDHPLKLNDDGTLPFYWFDAHEENYGADILLFGKVWQPEIQSFVSCTVVVKGMERTLFALPKIKNNKARGTLSEEEEKLIQQSMIIEFNNLRKNRFKNI